MDRARFTGVVALDVGLALAASGVLGTALPATAQEFEAGADTVSHAAVAPGADAVTGLWSTEPNDDGEYSHVEIYTCGELLCGRIVWLSHPTYAEEGEWGEAGSEKIDWNNGDEALRTRPILGLELMHSFRFDPEDDGGKWKDGRIYDPDNGKEYRCEMTLADGGEVLKVRGYVRIAFVNVGRTTEWRRVGEP